jgi:hypothetical protein
LAWRIELTATAARQLAKLDKGEARRISAFLRHRVAALEDPRSVGKALTGPMLGPSGVFGLAITASSATSMTARSASSSSRSAIGARCIADRRHGVDSLARVEAAKLGAWPLEVPHAAA